MSREIKQKMGSSQQILKKMTIKDKVYSEFKITSPIILELIKTKAFQRLKGISQFGVPNKYYHLDGYSRYEHSIGVYILLNRLGASEEEQVAGLLHDISHMAFSHLVDWVIGDSSKEDYQDKRHLSVLQEKEIAQILSKYGYSSENIADYHRFGLLEQDASDLCADRIDYAFRESATEIAEQCLPDLKVFNGKIVFSLEESALLFAENFLNRQIQHWAGYEAITRYVLLADLLKKTIQDKVINLEDFLVTDDFVINKVIKANKKEYLKVLNLLENKNLNFLARSNVSTKKKFRYVDPKILINGKLERLSVLSKEFSKKLEKARRSNDKGTYSGIFT
ncbi:MAG: HD domain-containing protein [bacterium]|nr:HD domain-containing protein [bacterium]